MTKISELQMEFLAPHIKKQILEKLGKGIIEKPKKSKYNATKVKEDGYSMDSKLEYRHMKQFDLLIRTGELLYYIQQVPFRLGNGEKHFVDFQLHWTDPQRKCTYWESKGIITAEYKRKIKLLKKMYPHVDIELHYK